jgi:hypothetical protein
MNKAKLDLMTNFCNNGYEFSGSITNRKFLYHMNYTVSSNRPIMNNVQKSDGDGDGDGDDNDDKYNYCVSRHYPSPCIYLKHTFQRLDSVSVFR